MAGVTKLAIGPVQLVVLGFTRSDFHGEVIDELERLRDVGAVRLLDSLAVRKGPDGQLEVTHLSKLTTAEAMELGSKIAALVGLGIDGEEAAQQALAVDGAEAAAEGVRVFSEQGAWDVLGDIPDRCCAALILLEYCWAVPLRDCAVRAGGFRISDGFISPPDLVRIGLMSAEESEELLAT
jgi:hypothetical protein